MSNNHSAHSDKSIMTPGTGNDNAQQDSTLTHIRTNERLARIAQSETLVRVRDEFVRALGTSDGMATLALWAVPALCQTAQQLAQDLERARKDRDALHDALETLNSQVEQHMQGHYGKR